MHTTRIAELLQPFLKKSCHSDEFCHSEQSEKSAHSKKSCHSEQSEESAVLSPAQLQNISTYIDLLLRWNARINLTAIRNEEEIVTRHFGESLFTARHLFPRITQVPAEQSSASLIDIGSGAGFPGLPIKICAPEIQVTLIESNQKKATFLREVIRTITLTDINVFHGRAENHPNQANVVTLRAVEHFNTTLPIAANLVAPGGRLAILIGESQMATLKHLSPTFAWRDPIQIPMSSSRILALGQRES